MFENPTRGRQARNFTTNVPKILDLKSSSEQIFSRKLSLGAPERGTFSKFAIYLRVGKIDILVCIRQGHKIGRKVEEMTAKGNDMKGCQTLAEMSMLNAYKLAPFEQLNHND